MREKLRRLRFRVGLWIMGAGTNVNGDVLITPRFLTDREVEDIKRHWREQYADPHRRVDWA